jgi:hypothetical protein
MPGRISASYKEKLAAFGYEPIGFSRSDAALATAGEIARALDHCLAVKRVRAKTPFDPGREADFAADPI